MFLLTDTLDVVAAHEVLLVSPFEQARRQSRPREQDQLGYGTRAGHFSLGEEATIPVQIVSELLFFPLSSPLSQILHALDTCLEGLVQAGVDLSTVRAVSGAAAQATVIYLNSSFEASLASLANKEHLRLSQHFVRAFASTTTPICLDASTVAQARAFGRCIPAATSIDITGSAQPYRSPALQLMKILQTESTCIDTTSHIMLASTFIASAFLGSVAPQDEADACSSGLYDIRKRCWSRDVIDAVLRAAGETRSGRTEGLVLKLGEVSSSLPRLLGSCSYTHRSREMEASRCAAHLRIACLSRCPCTAWPRLSLLCQAFRLRCRLRRVYLHWRQPSHDALRTAQAIRRNRVRFAFLVRRIRVSDCDTAPSASVKPIQRSEEYRLTRPTKTGISFDILLPHPTRPLFSQWSREPSLLMFTIQARRTRQQMPRRQFGEGVHTRYLRRLIVADLLESRWSDMSRRQHRPRRQGELSPV